MRGFKFLLYKKYFDTGMGLTSYLKYVIAFFGLASRDVKTTLIIAFGYALFCFILGFFWCNYGLIDTETEINNRFNPFCSEVRKSIRKRKI